MRSAAPPVGVAPRPRRHGAWWNDRHLRGLIWQAVFIAAVGLVLWYLFANALQALGRLGIATGFGFLGQAAGFGIGESLIPFSSADSYLRAYVVGILNTLRVSMLAILLATIIGTLLGLARLSSNLFVAGFASTYVELFRNTPQLLQIIFWYVVFTNLPQPRRALAPIEGVLISNRGVYFAVPASDPAHFWIGIAVVAGILGAILWRLRARLVQQRDGQRPAMLLPALAMIVTPPALAWAAFGMPMAMDAPALRGFNIQGGLKLSPEFLALLLGLSLYIAAFIAEIVRAGILSVGRGQVDAARALGLGQRHIYRLVVLPQALRVIVPPATGQYVSLVKNSSLAVAIGYPDLVNIGNTAINQTGHTVEGIVMIMVVYLTICLAVAAAMNWYNARVRLSER